MFRNFLSMSIALSCVSVVLMVCNNPTSNTPSLTAPTLIAPSNGASAVAFTPAFSWNSVNGATSYVVQVAIDPTFATGLVINDSSATATSLAVTTVTLPPNSLYYWRVFARNAGGRGPASTSWTFTTKAAEEAGPAAPAGAALILSEGFGGDLSKYEKDYMVTSTDIYPHMQITTAAAHAGTHSITGDSNQTALLYALNSDTRVESGIVGAQFYIMTRNLGEANFTVEIGKNAGSSGGLGKAFGIGFDPNDSLKCKYYDMLGNVTVSDTMLRPIQLGHWYKCVVEVDFTAKTVAYYVDDVKVWSPVLPASDMNFIDRLLVFRGATVERPNYGITPCTQGPQQYYVDDIVFYKK
jgi:hypothetical protein